MANKKENAVKMFDIQEGSRKKVENPVRNCVVFRDDFFRLMRENPAQGIHYADRLTGAAWNIIARPRAPLLPGSAGRVRCECVLADGLLKLPAKLSVSPPGIGRQGICRSFFFR